MIFNSFSYLIFFPVVTLLYFVLPRKIRWVWLLVSSYYFYMNWHAEYALLMAASTLVTYICALAVSRIAKPKARKAVLVGGIVFNLGMLGYFKYTGMFIDVLNRVCGALGFALRLPQVDILLPVGISYFGGGSGAADFGSPNHLLVGTFVIIVILIAKQFKGWIADASILVGIVAGYVLAICLGMVDFSPLADAAWLALPKFMPVMPIFDLQAIIAMCILFVATAVETVGNISGITNGAFDREPTPEEMRGGVMADSVGSLFGSFFGVLPVTTFAQNVGLVVVSRIVNRFVILTGVIFLLLCGFCPKISVLFSIMPQSVLGGAAVIMFSMIVVSGIQALGREKMDERTGLISALSLGLGVGIGNIPSVLAQLPEWVNMIFAQNSIIMTFVVATVLNLILPKKKAPEPAAKQDQA